MERMLRTDFPCRNDLNIRQGCDATVYPRRLVPREGYSNGQGSVLDFNGQFVELLGIWDKAVFLTRPTRFREGIIPEPSYLCMQYRSREYIATFDAIANNVLVEADRVP